LPPPEDLERSPYTGWTRAHWEHVADRMLAAARRHASPQHALIAPPGRRTSTHGAGADRLEGFARSFLLAAFRLAGAEGRSPGNLAEWYAEGLRAGTLRDGPEAWPRGEETRQAVVEAASVAHALAETRPWIWDRLDDPTRDRIVDWLTSARGQSIVGNNWVLFPVLIETFLKSVGAPHVPSAIEDGLDFIDSCYRRDGWYTDGTARRYDYYNGWAIHFSTLLWCRLDGDRSDPSRAAVYREHARRYLGQYRYLFASNGAPIYHGRSLIYRFATAAPLWAGALAGATPLAPGETRRIASGTLRYFVDHGALEEGTPTLGWHGEFPRMVQAYSGAGSPYWGGRGFLGLLIPPRDPVWTAIEEGCAVERADFCVAMPEPGFLVRGTRADGVVRLASHRSDHYPIPGRLRPLRGLGLRGVRRASGRRQAVLAFLQRVPGHPGPARDDPHYRKLAYSSHTAPDQGPQADILDLDSQFSLLDGTANVVRRTRMHEGQVIDRFGASVWFGDERLRRERVEAVTIARGPAEIRVHHVTSRIQPAREGGFAVAATEPPEVVSDERWSMVRRADGLTSFVGGLHGFAGAGASRLQGANPFGRHSTAPFLVGRAAGQIERVYVSLCVLTADGFDADAALGDLAVHVDRREVTITCRDGECFYVQLVAPEMVERELGRVRIEGRVRFARVSPDGTVFKLEA
jgi:hypothetical protein